MAIPSSREALSSRTSAGEGVVTDLATIRRFLLAQDNAGTSHPVFVVQRRVREYGYDDDYHESTACWVNSDEQITLTAQEQSDETTWTFERLEQLSTELDVPEGWNRTHYVDRWEYVQPFFTRQGADDYIASERHNLGLARVVVESAHRNPEWQAIRALLMAQPLSETFDALANAISAEAKATSNFALAMSAMAYGVAGQAAREAGL
jgi:hypothetical protein